MNEIRVQENDAMFDEIMKHCVVNMNIDCWDYSSDNQSRHLQWTLKDKKTGHHVGWLVYKEWADAPYYIKIKEDSLHELLKQDRCKGENNEKLSS